MARIRFKHGTAAEWTAANPVLLVGEPGFETDTGQHKVGNGYSAWNDLPYAVIDIGLPYVFTWDGSTYQPANHIANMTRQKWFTGPIDPTTVGATLAPYDQWIDTTV